jgi:hypothetical protein
MGNSEGLIQPAQEVERAEGNQTPYLTEEPEPFRGSPAERQATPLAVDDYAEGDIGHGIVDTRSVALAT